MGIYVTSVNPVGAAAIDGGINVRDRIVKVDGYSLRGLDNMEAATVLRNCGNPVRLVLCRERLPHESMGLIRGVCVCVCVCECVCVHVCVCVCVCVLVVA